ncbi:hypothetical protein ACLM5H_00515 [Fredinandcohnia humi]
MVLIKNCIIVLLFAIILVGMIFYGVNTIEAKGNEAATITKQIIMSEKL